MSAGMVSIKGRLQKEGQVIHVTTDRLEDLTPLLHSVGGDTFPHPDEPGRWRFERRL